MSIPIRFVTWDDDGEEYELAQAHVLDVPRKGDTVHLLNLVPRTELQRLGKPPPNDIICSYEDVAFVVTEVVREFDADPQRTLAQESAIRIELALPPEDRRWPGANRSGSDD